MPPAIIGGAIAGIGAIGAAAIGNKGASNAAAATTQAANTAAQVQRDNYAQSAAALQPWQQSGMAANSQLNALLGLSPTTSYGQSTQSFGTPQANTMAYADPSQNPAYQPYISEFTNPKTGQVNWGGLQSFVGDTGWQQAPQQQMVTAPAPQQGNPWDGFKNYLAGSDYAFQFGQGANKVNSGYAGAGTLQSGAAMKALEGYRQNLQAGYRGEYMGALGNQQQIGFNAASAQAGVGQNTANNLASIYTNQGDNLANAALAKAQNTGNTVNALAMIGSNILGKK